MAVVSYSALLIFPFDFTQLVVIGDRPDAATTPTLLERLADWQ
jgi:hypothetical protein